MLQTLLLEQNGLVPIGSMYGIFTYIWLIFMVNVGKYTIHGWYGVSYLNKSKWFNKTSNEGTLKRKKGPYLGCPWNLVTIAIYGTYPTYLYMEVTLPETDIAPENSILLLGSRIFRCYVGLRESIIHLRSTSRTSQYFVKLHSSPSFSDVTIRSCKTPYSQPTKITWTMKKTSCLGI